MAERQERKTGDHPDSRVQGEITQMLKRIGLRRKLLIQQIERQTKSIAESEHHIAQAESLNYSFLEELAFATCFGDLYTLDADQEDELTVDHQIRGLLEGLGADEDHADVLTFLHGTGLTSETVKRVHAALINAESPLPNALRAPTLEERFPGP